MFADGTIESARMLLPFYDATIEMRVPRARPEGVPAIKTPTTSLLFDLPAPPPARPERGPTIIITVGGQNGRNPRPTLTIQMTVPAAISLVASLQLPHLIDAVSLPASTDAGRTHEHARQGVVRAFLSIFGPAGKHLVEAALWAVTNDFVPERPEIAEGLAKYFFIPTRGSEGIQIAWCDTSELSPALAAWALQLRTFEVAPELKAEFQRFIPYTE